MLRSSGVGFQQTEPDKWLDRVCAHDLVGVEGDNHQTPPDCSAFGDAGLKVSAAVLIARDGSP
jgi:hypothetical protein